VALAKSVLIDLSAWKEFCADIRGFVFPSEAGTPLSKNNVWRRNMRLKLKRVGLEWCNFQVMRRTHHADEGIERRPKLVSDQMGHTLDVNQNVYTQSSVEMRLPLVNTLDEAVLR